MAAGTVVSRLSGFVRGTLLAAALGVGLHADVFTIANTVPNMLYILLAGGVFNAVLVPQLVRAMKNDARRRRGLHQPDHDAGRAVPRRGDRAAGGRGAAADAAVPRRPRSSTPTGRPSCESVVAFARYCLPQVFFYGMFVLVGQVLNARGRFGPMMWAPIANNVIAVAVLVVYLLLHGRARGPELAGRLHPRPGGAARPRLHRSASWSQLLVLLPYLRSAGFRYRPRFDFRGAGLGHTLRLGLWTVLFVVVNQVAYTVVVRLASSGTVGAGLRRAGARAPATRSTPTPSCSRWCRTRSSRSRWPRRCCRCSRRTPPTATCAAIGRQVVLDAALGAGPGRAGRRAATP